MRVWRLVLVVLLALQAMACASLATWSNSDPALAQFLRHRGTHCDALPRAYSGFHFDRCWLDSDPQRIYGSAPMILLLGDGLLSAIADTVALPVTLRRQRQHGDIPLRQTPLADETPGSP